MLFGLSSFAFGWAVQLEGASWTAARLLEFGRARGAGVVQLADNLPVHRLPPDDRAALKAAARTAGLRLELGARGLTEAHLQTYIGLSRDLEVSLLRFVVDAPGWEPAIPDLAALLRNAGPALAAAGLTLAIENHDRFPARTLRRLIDDLASRHVGVCLDTANSLGAGEGLEHVTDWLAPVTVNVHVKDVTIRRLPHQMGFIVQGCPLGQGQLNLRALLERLHREGYRGSVLLESWSPPAPEDAVTVATELAAVDAGWRTLQEWRLSFSPPPEILPA